uniref:Uncharacterized protein n=1 Tax=Rhizophora mucronata TaxID=61149 RepID=A0A2P2IKL1_RHIMU
MDPATRFKQRLTGCCPPRIQNPNPRRTRDA